MRRVLPTTAATIAATLLVVGPAAAHVSANPSEASSGAYARFAFRVPHGCDGAPTDEVAIRVPAGVASVKPEFVPGWDVSSEVGPYDEPVELHGEEITEGVQSVTWTAQPGQELPDDQFREFGLSVKLPDGEAGDVLYFPTVQSCPDGGEIAWIEIPSGDEELESPAPAVTLTAATDGHGHGAPGDDEPDGDAGHAASSGGTAEAAPAGLAAAEGTDPLLVVALAVGVLGLGVGAAGLATARRAR